MCSLGGISIPKTLDAISTYHSYSQQVAAKIPDNPKETGCGEKVTLAIVKLPYIQTEGAPPRKGAVHVALGGWSQSSTNFLVQFGEDYAPVFVGYDLVAIGKSTSI